MRYFGINYTPFDWGHDGGVACFDDNGELALYSQTERASRKKNDSTVGVLADLLAACGLDPITPDDLFFTTWHHYKPFFDRQVWPQGFFEKKESFLRSFDASQQVHFLNHHMCHIAGSWMFREDTKSEEKFYIALDGGGHREDGSPAYHSVGVISPAIFEEHHFAIDEVKFSPRERLNRIALPDTAPVQVAGKLMGLAGYVPQDMIHYLQRPYFHMRILNKRLKEEGLTNWAMAECASSYSSYIQDVKAYLGALLLRYAQKEVVVGGGVFLALELNSWLTEQGRKVVFAPCINDSGTALGSAAYGYFLAKGKWPEMLKTPYLQWQPDEIRPNYLSPTKAAICLANGEIIGLLTGKGEAGPRALGNRSLLAIPSKENAQKISVEIKGREYYRPIAPIVTDREFPNLFTGPQGRYMQFRNFCTPHAKKVVPGVVHNDDTARAQVLRPDDHPWLYETLVEIGKITGAECLINTSLNVRGRPICNTLADFTSEFSGTKIRAVSF